MLSRLVSNVGYAQKPFTVLWFLPLSETYAEAVGTTTFLIQCIRPRVCWTYSKATSLRECIMCEGNTDKPLDNAGWRLTEVMKVLGHMIQDDGGLRHE